MFDLDKWQEIFQAIAKNKMRTFATAFGVFWGILMLIMLLGAGQGLQNGVQQSMLLDAINSIWIIPTRTSMSYEGMPSGRQHPFQEEDLETVSSEISGIEFMSPENWLQGNYNVKYKNRSTAFGVFGTKSVLSLYESKKRPRSEIEVGLGEDPLIGAPETQKIKKD